MRKLPIIIVLTALLSAAAHAADILEWNELPPLPPVPGQTIQPGLAGPFAGVHNDALIVAGGANFPDGLPWIKRPDGSSAKKIFQRDIYVLLKTDRGYEWQVSDLKLPHGYSYGASIASDDGLICIGGTWRTYEGDETRNFKSDKVFTIRHTGRGQVTIDEATLPNLPEGLDSMGAAKIGNTIYLAGGGNAAGATKTFLRLDLSNKDTANALAWEALDPWPGPPRFVPVAAAQGDGIHDCFYLFSGRSLDAQGDWQCLADTYKFNPFDNTWTRLADVGTNLSDKDPVCVMAAAGCAMGINHIVVFGGSPGDLFVKVEQDMAREAQALRDAGKTAEADARDVERWDLYTKHPGFSRDILVYHTITDVWAPMGSVPQSEIAGRTAGSHVTTTAVRWGDDIVIPSGEVRPGVRSPRIWVAKPAKESLFGFLNYTVLGVYLAALVAMGFYFSKRERTTNDFFRAGQRVPWWAAGLSIFATGLSAITFMAIPAKSFATDWQWACMNATIILAVPFTIRFFLPFYRRLNVTTAYEYIEMRFNVVVRVIASAMFILFQFARIGIVLYLPSIALSVVTGIDIWVCITVMAVLSILYTVMGGIEAVIWTDVLQVIVLMGGAIAVLFMIPGSVPGGGGGMVHLALDADKLRLFDFHFRFDSATFWVLTIGGFSGNIIGTGTDQATIQRYLTTRDERGAARGLWVNAFMAIPATLIFFGIGSALYAFFKSNPTALSPALQQADAIFPWFIVTQLPAGIAGLLIAGIFAAAMSSLDSSMNSVATAYTTDFYQRFKPSAPDHRCLQVARLVTVVIGLCGMGFALAMATWDIKSLWNEFTKYLGLFGGGLGGLFVLAIFTRKAHWKGALIGLIASAAVQFALNAHKTVHGVMFAATGMVSCFVIGYLASIVLPGEKKDLDGLTVHTLEKAGR